MSRKERKTYDQFRSSVTGRYISAASAALTKKDYWIKITRKRHPEKCPAR